MNAEAQTPEALQARVKELEIERAAIVEVLEVGLRVPLFRTDVNALRSYIGGIVCGLNAPPANPFTQGVNP